MGLLLPLTIYSSLGYAVLKTIYNIFFHPLSKVPGPFWARVSSIPSWYHAYKGDRHIWIWQQFQLYGRKFRATPNTVLFNTPEAYNSIYSHKANVKKSNFYDTWVRNENDINTLGCTDVAEHARKRKLINLAFTDKSTKEAGKFIVRHVDRWDELLVAGKKDADGWSEPRNMTEWTDYLMFDIVGDLAFGADFGTKEPDGDVKLKSIPHRIVEYVTFMYPIARSPFLELILWLKPRGLNTLMEILTPKDVKYYYKFVEDLALKRIAAEKDRLAKDLPPDREDLFHFLLSAKDPDTNQPAYSTLDLIAESHLLIVAGADSSSVTLCALFFYLTRNPRVLLKLEQEIRSTFSSVEEIFHGPKLASCKYLRAVIDESLRMCPAGPSELSRVVLPGGAIIDGSFYPEGTHVGTAGWAYNHCEALYGDAYTFRPERWIPSSDLSTLNTDQDILKLKRGFHPFSQGPGNCAGMRIAVLQLSLVVARTVWRMEVRGLEGERLGEGGEERGWGERDERVFLVRDKYVTVREGPVVQFRRREV